MQQDYKACSSTPNQPDTFKLIISGRPRLRWVDCVKRDVKKAGEEEDWKKKKTRDRGGWRRIADEAMKKLQAAPHP